MPPSSRNIGATGFVEDLHRNPAEGGRYPNQELLRRPPMKGIGTQLANGFNPYLKQGGSNTMRIDKSTAHSVAIEFQCRQAPQGGG
jgi:hypothetical protein